MSELTMANLKDRVGQEMGASCWTQFDQTRIGQFAECTGDRLWIRVGAERAKRESQFKGSIAHGYRTLPLIESLSLEVGVVPSDAAAGFNYGLDKVRFLAPVPGSARVRLSAPIIGIGDKSDGQILLKTRNVIEIEDSDKPALIADAPPLLIAQGRSK